MCVAVSAKVISINEEKNTAKVEVNKNILNVNISLVSPQVGDYVLVHAGCAIEIISSDTAEEIESLFAELLALGEDSTE